MYLRQGLEPNPCAGFAAEQNQMRVNLKKSRELDISPAAFKVEATVLRDEQQSKGLEFC
jgi:hypothetical protein